MTTRTTVPREALGDMTTMTTISAPTNRQPNILTTQPIHWLLDFVQYHSQQLTLRQYLHTEILILKSC